MPSSRGAPRPGGGAPVSCTAGGLFTAGSAWEALRVYQVLLSQNHPVIKTATRQHPLIKHITQRHSAPSRQG